VVSQQTEPALEAQGDNRKPTIPIWFRVFGTQLDREDQAEAEGKPKSSVDREPDSEDDGREKSEADGEEHGRAEGDPFGEAQGKVEGRCEGKAGSDSNPGHEGEPVREQETWQKRAPEGDSDCGHEAEADRLPKGPPGDAHTGYRALTRTNLHFPGSSSRILQLDLRPSHFDLASVSFPDSAVSSE